MLAARRTFRDQGFDGASTRAIAAAAGVNSSLIFRYFGSKAALYETAVLAPLEAFMAGYLRDWDGYESAPHTAQRVATEYLGGLYDLFVGHRDLVLALVGSGSAGPALRDRDSPVAGWMATLIDGVRVVVDTETARRGWPEHDSRMSIRMALGLAFSQAALRDWLFPDGDERPDREQVVAAMVSYVLRSMSNPGGPHGA